MALAPWEAAAITLALAFGMLVGSGAATATLGQTREADAFSPEMQLAPSSLLS